MGRRQSRRGGWEFDRDLGGSRLDATCGLSRVYRWMGYMSRRREDDQVVYDPKHEAWRKS